MPLLVFHLVQAFGTVKGFLKLITKTTIMSLSISRKFYAPVNFDEAIWLLLISTFWKNGVVCYQRILKSELLVAIAQRTFNRFWIALH